MGQKAQRWEGRSALLILWDTWSILILKYSPFHLSVMTGSFLYCINSCIVLKALTISDKTFRKVAISKYSYRHKWVDGSMHTQAIKHMLQNSKIKTTLALWIQCHQVNTQCYFMTRRDFIAALCIYWELSIKCDIFLQNVVESAIHVPKNYVMQKYMWWVIWMISSAINSMIWHKINVYIIITIVVIHSLHLLRKYYKAMRMISMKTEMLFWCIKTHKELMHPI